MAGSTDHYGLSITAQGDSLADNGYKHTSTDRRTIDRKLYQGAEGHHHLGGSVAFVTTPAVPTLTRFATGGLIPAGTRVYYKVALVSSSGEEGAASAEAYIDTPAAAVEPAAPTLTYLTTGGALYGGDYYYALSAYVGANSSETRATGATFVTVVSTTGTNKVTVQFPSTPAGATGFNIYRRGPGESRYSYLTSQAMAGGLPVSFVDTGALTPNQNRTIPVVNTTNATNRIVVTYPGATPVVPTGYTWNIYRTYLNAQYTQSLLKHVVEFTSEATPTIITFFSDVGNATGSGTPVTVVPTIANPSKILLTSGAEVQGTLAPVNMVFCDVVEFAFPGTLVLTTGTFAWRCPYDHARIAYAIISLGVGSLAAGTQVIVDVNKYTLASSTWATIFTTQANRPRILVGYNESLEMTPNVTSLVKGDKLSVDIDQVAVAATPTDTDLLVQIKLWYSDATATSIVIP